MTPKVLTKSQAACLIALQHGKAVRGYRDVVAQVAIGAPVESGQFHIGPRGLDDLHRLRDDFLAYAVSGDDGDAFPSRGLRLLF